MPAAVTPLKANESRENSMKGAVYYGKEDVKIQDVPIPSYTDSEVLVKVAYCGICGTDLHEFLDGANFCPLPDKPHPISGTSLPLVLGHEYSGTIVKVGTNLASKYQVGQKVAIQPDFGCTNCYDCNHNQRNCCSQMGFVGLSGPPGGLGEYSALGEGNIHVLPDSIPLDIGALVEPLAVAWHAVRTSKLQAGQSALVIGSGPIGAATIRSLKALGAGTVICAEPTSQRQEIAKASGADVVVNPIKDDVAAACRKATNGRGVDVALDAAGLANGNTLNTCIDSTRAGGMITNIAIHNAKVPLDLVSLYMRERTLNGIIGYTRQDFVEVIEALAAGKLKAADMITGRIAVEDLVEKGFMALKNEKDKHVKILVKMA